MSSTLANTQTFINQQQAGVLATDRVARTSNWGHTELSTNWHLGTDEHTPTVNWDVSQDAAVGVDDHQIAEMDSAKAVGGKFDQAAYDKVVAHRQQLNGMRWTTANLSGSPAKDQVAQLIRSGALTYADLAKIDISVLNDDSKLTDAVKGIMDAKASASKPAVGPTSTTNDADAARVNAESAVTAGMAHLQDYAKNISDAANSSFNQQVQEKGSAIESLSNQSAQGLGLGAASGAAGEASANLEANAIAGKAVVEGQTKSDIQKFIETNTQEVTGQTANLEGLSGQAKIDMQAQGLSALKDEIMKSVDMSDTKAAGKVQEVQAAIDAWNVKVKAGEEATAEMNKILMIAGGVLMAAVGTAASIVTAGAATPFMAPVVAGGIGLASAGVAK